MPDEHRIETPTSDRIVQREISISVILQGCILAAIIGSVSVLLDIKDTLGELSAAQRVTASEIAAIKQTVIDHEDRIRNVERKN